MVAIIEDRSRQYRVSVGDILELDLQEAQEGEEIIFDKVSFSEDAEGAIKIGTPHIYGAKVSAKVLGDTKGQKIIVTTFRRRKDSRTRTGHRQKFSKVRIEKIEV